MQENTEKQTNVPITKHINVHFMNVSRDSSVCIATDYGLDDRIIRVRFQAGAGNFSLHHRVKNGSGAHPASYPMGFG
jgi:6-phosphogluconolactonase (cycloisomerase 2 family)